jgi:murein DD-endopeptidase MepM/ murein hydrolase activator NlpD
MIVIKHDDGFYSVYAHHSKNLVKVGKHVSRGDKIALSGRSGRASGPHLHFEIRRGVESFDPIFAINENMKKSLASRKVASDSPQ